MNKLNQQFLNFIDSMKNSSAFSPEMRWEDLFDWLKNHKKYDAKSFWRETDEEGDHFYTVILKINSDVASEIYSLWLNEIKDSEESFFNNKNKHKKTLLHICWDEYLRLNEKSKNGYYSYTFRGSDIPALLTEIANKTNKDNFTWLDTKANVAGSGIISKIISLLSSSPHQQELQKFLSIAAKHFPQDSASSKSWISMYSSEQASAMLESGFSLEDEVPIRKIKVPAWKWMVLQNPSCKNLDHLISNNLSKDSLDDYYTLKEEIRAWKEDSNLIAKDRRERIGYVRRVLKTQGQDPWGRSSIDYLFLFRKDLTEQLLAELYTQKYPIEKFKENFLTPDKMGYSICTRAISRLGSSSLKLFFDFLTQNNLPINFGFEKRGVLKDNIENKAWHSATESFVSFHNNEVQLNPTSIDVLAELDEKLIFGNDKTQKEWVEYWNKFFILLKDSFDSKDDVNKITLPVSIQKYAAIQVYAFSKNNYKWKDKLDNTLFSQLKFASCIYSAYQDLLSFNRFGTNFNLSSWDSDFPDLYTKEMKELLHSIPKLSSPNDIKQYSRTKMPCIKHEFIADVSKKDLSDKIKVSKNTDIFSPSKKRLI